MGWKGQIEELRVFPAIQELSLQLVTTGPSSLSSTGSNDQEYEILLEERQPNVIKEACPTQFTYQS